MMTESQKKEIQEQLSDYVSQFQSQAKAVKSLKGVSEAVVINVKKGKWESISDEMWINISKQVKGASKDAWKIVETAAYKSLVDLFDDAKEFSNAYAIVAPAGSGKSATAKKFEEDNDNVYHIVCAEYFNRKTFLQLILEKMGVEKTGTAPELMERIVEKLLRQEHPLLILDEADKLNDQVLYFFITLYNMLQGKCGIVMCATNYLDKRIDKGIRLNKKGYNEIFSRVGRRFVRIPSISKEEIIEICKKNGVTDSETITSIYNESTVKGLGQEDQIDLRRVERGVHKAKKKRGKK